MVKTPSIFSQQRVIVQCLTKLSRDSDTDVSVLLADAMANRYTKFPMLASRPKSISDLDRVPLTLTTVQLAENTGKQQ